MTNEKAIEEIKHIKQYFHVDGESLDLAIQALEKQVPKEPEYGAMKKVIYYSCPVCGRLYWEKEYIGNYCDSCGQRIGWKECKDGQME